MPHMTGIELRERPTELGYAIPTILITASGTVSWLTAEQAVRLQCD